ncbi:hypothetical protein JCM4814A_88120 [Streptomyces phaeofaciens JCM 4814]|uniref:Uncharacterized protein n=1 Tax=Streptomyces phaeofaciens TaxID=68254 RepID=A0A918HBD1_9ACTN|nr:hypothetical protein [Streptomyces phaeofaciens]GGT51859.1 hypothetical protein GCM10010226_31280 [Streptomyces phaeofaciens]
MSRQPQPRRITLGGREAVALTLEEYERLIASRRQIGGQSARVRVLGQQVKRTEQLLHELETLVAVPAEGCERTRREHSSGGALCHTAPAPAADTDTDCLRCAIADLLRRHRDPAS